MEDVFDVLAEDHEEIRQALAELEKGPTAASGASEDQLMLRMIMTEELILEEAKHEEIELTCIWPAVRGQIPGGDQLADRAVCAELEIVALLAELNQADVARPEFERLLGAFTRAAREHFDFEERQVWPRLRSVLTAKATDELAGRILVARQAVPVPPFPRASASSS
ncbi:MAG TPA: hemerythrin domain-containing protein [Streptosporangiaceae bacterium]|nr:hemerythrin domain-containing protein [Streptosporangiaceae bacterium]